MISNNIWVAEGPEKERYLKNLVDALDKLQNNEDIPEIKKISDLLRIYYLDDCYGSNFYRKIDVNMNTGFPNNENIKKLFKKDDLINVQNKTDIIADVKAYLRDEKNLDSIIKEHGMSYFVSETKNLENLKSNYEVFTNNDNVTIIEYYNQPIITKIGFKGSDKENIHVVEDVLRDLSIYSVPRSLGNFFNFVHSKLELKPNNLEKNLISFYNSKTESDPEKPELKSILKNKPDSYLLKFAKEKINIFQSDTYEKGFLGIKKRKKILEKENMEESRLYICSKDIYSDVLELISIDNSRLVS